MSADHILVVDISFLHRPAKRLGHCEIVEQVLIHLGDEIYFDREMEEKNGDLCRKEILSLGQAFGLDDEETLAWLYGLREKDAERVRRLVRPSGRKGREYDQGDNHVHHPDLRIAAWSHLRARRGGHVCVLTCDRGLLQVLSCLGVCRRCFKAALHEADKLADGKPKLLPSKEYGTDVMERRPPPKDADPFFHIHVNHHCDLCDHGRKQCPLPLAVTLSSKSPDTRTA